MPLLAALIATVAPVQAPPAPSPLFAAFKAACAQVGDFDKVGGASRAAGWREIASADADPRITAIVAKGNEAVSREEPTAKTAGQLFVQSIDGRSIYLATSRVEFKVEGKDAWGNGCRAYDLDAPAAPSTEAVTAWVGAAPTGTQASGNATKASWEPWVDGTSLEITYVPRDNPLGSQFGIQGLILVSQAMGGF